MCQTFVITDLLLHSHVELLGLIFIRKVYSYLTLLHAHTFALHHREYVPLTSIAFLMIFYIG